MRTVPFKSVLWSIAKKAGLIPATDGLDRPIAAEITEAINTAVKLAWEYSDWPELCLITAQTVSTSAQASGGTFFTLPYLDSNGYHYMGSVLNVWDANPLASSRATRVDYTLGTDAVYLPQDAPATVFVRYRLPHGVYTDDEYTTRKYVPGEVVYRPEDGECYRCTAIAIGTSQFVTNSDFATNITGWTNSGSLWSWAAGADLSGVAQFSCVPANAVAAAAGLFQTFLGLTTGATYRATLDLTINTAAVGYGSVKLLITMGGSTVHLSAALTGSQVYNVDFVATASSATFTVQLFPVGLPGPFAGSVNRLTCRDVLTVTPPPYSGSVQNTANWEVVPFPKILAEAVKHGGLASWRRSEGQDASAMQLENIMSEWLDHELDLVSHQQQQGKHWRR